MDIFTRKAGLFERLDNRGDAQAAMLAELVHPPLHKLPSEVTYPLSLLVPTSHGNRFRL